MRHCAQERISTWLPPLFLHVLEVIVLSLNFYHDRGRKSEAGDESTQAKPRRPRRNRSLLTLLLES